jgi:hypothetical protein
MKPWALDNVLRLNAVPVTTVVLPEIVSAVEAFNVTLWVKDTDEAQEAWPVIH